MENKKHIESPASKSIQGKKLAGYRKRWTKILLDNSPLDHARIEQQINKMYMSLVGHHPRSIIWLPSPQACAHKYAELHEYDEPIRSKEERIREAKSKFEFGNHSAPTMYVYEYMIRECGIEVGTAASMIKLNKLCHWYIPDDKVAIMCEKPVEQHILVDPFRFHNVDGPAIRYSDGFEAYYIDGELTQKHSWLL